MITLNRLEVVWQYLADQLQPGPTRRGETALSDARRAQLDDLLRRERAELVHQQRNGLPPMGASPAPLRVAVVDAMRATASTVHEAAWTVRMALGDGAPVFVVVLLTEDGRFHQSVRYLRAALPRVDAEVARSVEADLILVDRMARSVAGVGDDRRPLKTECPACGRRSLVAEVGPVDAREWYITCRRDCRCQGPRCGCNLPTRYAGMAHIWPSRRFGELATLLERRETGDA